jgi:hypothetical protein
MLLQQHLKPFRPIIRPRLNHKARMFAQHNGLRSKRNSAIPGLGDHPLAHWLPVSPHPAQERIYLLNLCPVISRKTPDFSPPQQINKGFLSSLCSKSSPVLLLTSADALLLE